MNLTRQEITVICLLLAAVIAGGIIRLCKKGWTVPGNPPSMTQPTPAASSRP